MHNFNNLQIWKNGMDLAQAIYEITESFPSSEKFGIVSQMTRAAVSVPSNIAEGAGRRTDKDFAHFLYIAIGSLYELHTQVILCERIGYLTKQQSKNIQDMIDNLQRMTIGYLKNLTSNNEVV